jgi:tetratricopeptide (TPR) repeat protein
MPRHRQALYVACNSSMTLRFLILILGSFLFSACSYRSADYYLNQGYEMGLTNDFRAAIKLFDNAIQKDPKLKEAYIQRGICYENLNQYDSAINSYSTLLRIDPNNTTGLYYIGLCKYSQTKYSEAIEFYNKALMSKGVANPSDSSIVQIAIDFNKNGILGERAKFDVEASEIYYERGCAYFATNQIKRAFFDFDHCIKKNYLPGESNYMTGLCWLTVDNKEKACESFIQGARFGDSLSRKQILKACN